MTALVLLALLALVAAVAWRPHGVGPALGAAAAVALCAVAGAVGLADLRAAAAAQWRAFLTLGSIMVMTAAAAQLGLFERLAAVIEPRTRGPVKRAFRVTFMLSALVAAGLSNDAAILVMTPTVLTLVRTVYPRRHPKFLVPFALAVFASAGVAPLVVSNPMNLVFAEHVGLGFNQYALVMAPVALVGWLCAYAVLSWVFRDVLADPAPALGAWPTPAARLSAAARAALVVVVLSLVAYPVAAAAGVPTWPVAGTGALLCAVIALAAGTPAMALVRGVAWPVFPFLIGVFVLAMALEHVGAVAWLGAHYAEATAPTWTVGVASTLGSAALNNHPMSVLNAFALAPLDDPGRALSFAALIGGDLGPRLLPVGSLAALLWYDQLRRQGVAVPLRTFVRVGLWLTVPTLVVSLAVLSLLVRL